MLETLYIKIYFDVKYLISGTVGLKERPCASLNLRKSLPSNMLCVALSAALIFTYFDWNDVEGSFNMAFKTEKLIRHEITAAPYAG